MHRFTLTILLIACASSPPSDDPDIVSMWDAPDGEDWVAVDAGIHNLTCGVRANGTTDCWGWDADEGAGGPDSAVGSISVADRGCGLSPDGAVVCGAAREHFPQWTIGPGGPYTSLSASRTHVCAIDDAGQVDCWGPNPPMLPQTTSRVVEIDTATDSTCVRLDDDTVDCTGDLVAPEGLFVDVDCSGQHCCAVPRDEAGLVCWGDGPKSPAAPSYPDAPAMATVSAGSYADCGLTQTGEPACFTEQLGVTVDMLPRGPIEVLVTGTQQVCGLQPGGRIVCERIQVPTL